MCTHLCLGPIRPALGFSSKLTVLDLVAETTSDCNDAADEGECGGDDKKHCMWASGMQSCVASVRSLADGEG